MTANHPPLPTPEQIRAEAPPPMPAWARKGIARSLWYARSRIGDHGRLPPQKRLLHITRNVYVGGQIGLFDWRRMSRWGVSALVNMRVEWDDRRFGINTPYYLWLPVIDGTAATLEQLHQGALFIHEQVAAGRGVYVHCAAGFGRAPSQVTAYLISCGFEINEAIQFIAERRPLIALSGPQRRRLEQFERYWKEWLSAGDRY